jgi:hypothetical protein
MNPPTRALTHCYFHFQDDVDKSALKLAPVKKFKSRTSVPSAVARLDGAPSLPPVHQRASSAHDTRVSHAHQRASSAHQTRVSLAHERASSAHQAPADTKTDSAKISALVQIAAR